MPDMDPRHLDIIKDILRMHIPDRTVWLFGSRAIGNARLASDADLAILGDSPLGLSRLANLREAFQASDLPFRVDLVEWANTREEFRSIIQAHYVALQEGSNQ